MCASCAQAGPAAQRPVPPPVAADRKSKERRRLFVGNVPPSVLDAELLSLFAPFGAERVDTPRDAAGAPRGFGFVEFGSEAQALTALGAMQNFALVDRVLRLSRPSVLDARLDRRAAPSAGQPPPPTPPRSPRCSRRRRCPRSASKRCGRWCAQFDTGRRGRRAVGGGGAAMSAPRLASSRRCGWAPAALTRAEATVTFATTRPARIPPSSGSDGRWFGRPTRGAEFAPTRELHDFVHTHGTTTCYRT